jgi:hypothetical protein
MSLVRLPSLASLTAALLAVWLLAWVGPAVAGPRQDVEKRASAAMESYDLLEYETAKKLLLSALELARDGRLENDPLTAKVHLSLGIVYFAGLQDKAAARRAFIEAVTIDPQIALPAAYKTPDMSTLLETVRAATAPARKPPPDRGPDDGTGVDRGTGQSGGAPGGGPSTGVDCLTISGLAHRQIERSRRGAPQRVVASLGGDVQASKVALFVRGLRKPEFVELRMTRDRDCTYTGTVPGNLLSGDTIHYYVAAVNAKGTVVASSGSPGAPNLIELYGPEGAVDGGAEENPLVEDPADPAPEPQKTVFLRASPRAAAKGGGRKLLFSLSAASGLGYVTGETEQQRNKVQCCIAPGLFTLVGEIGYALSPRLTLSGVVRLGFPIGANLDGHSPLGPAGFARARFSFAPSSAQSGPYLAGQLGAGIIRNTLKLTEQAVEGMDTDIVALGPLLIGAGGGYSIALSPMLSLQVDLTAIAGLPVVDELDTSRLNFGVQFDASLGAAFRF